MSFFELLVLIGVDPKVEPWKAYIWFTSAIFICFLVMIGGAIGYHLELIGELWFLFLIPVILGFHFSGRVYGILDSNKDRSPIRDIRRFAGEMLFYRINREQSPKKFILWQVTGYIVGGLILFFVFRNVLEGGSFIWGLLFIPYVIGFLALSRHFGHYR